MREVIATFRMAGFELVPPRGKEKEWLLTNGLGGFAASTVAGINTRRYHGLLIAALQPPVDRRVLLSKFEEEVFIDGRKYSLFASQTVGGYSGHGFNYLHEFRRFPFPLYTFRLEDVFIRKEIFMVNGSNTVLIRYQVLNENNRQVNLLFYPLVTCRDYHWTIRRNDWPFYTTITGQQVIVEAYAGAPRLYLAADSGKAEKTGFWYYDVFYEAEASRGLDPVEDLYCPVRFAVQARGNQVVTLGASTGELHLTQDWVVRKRGEEIARMRSLVEANRLRDDYLDVLTLAADDFIVERRNMGKKTIIAGYPWFSDWGRDAMIALPGLTLVTGRFDDARQIIGNFIAHEKDGLLPNMFPDDATPPAYNTVDAALWIFWTLYKYVEYTGDWGLAADFYPRLQEIIARYGSGTRYGIKMDEDGLVSQGEEGLALTWMDARVKGQAVTPRRGKPVEVNALWHFALRFMALLARRLGQVTWLGDYQALADRVRGSFTEKFWNDRQKCLYDVIDHGEKDASVRCNQIIAVSLPVRLLDRERELAVVRKVWQCLYTTYGLRSLSPESPQYRGRYEGNEHERDRAYHQGTVWVWPWGHFVTAVNRLYTADYRNRQLVRRMILPFLYHLSQQCIGTVAEIFDGDPPHAHRGCFAQAWSVGEVLRVYAEEFLGVRGAYKIELD